MEGPRPDKFAFAQRSGAMKAPVGHLSDRTVLRSKMEGPRPDKFAFAQRSGAMKAPVGHLSDRTVLRSKMEGPRPDKFAFAQRSGAMKAPVGHLSDRTVLRSKMEGPCPDKFAFGVRIGRVVDECRPVKGCIRKWLYPILPCGGHQDVGLLCQLVVKACADADDLIGHKADLDISVISMQQESAVLALHVGKTGADLNSFYSSRWFLIKNASIPPQKQDIFRKMGATYSLLYPE